MLIMTVILCFIYTTSESSPSATFYIRLDQKTRNGVYLTDVLTMTPADDDFRKLSFRKIRIKGQVLTSSGTDYMLEARNDAYENLLIKKGTKSIRAKIKKDNESSLEESVVSYEGYVKIPHKVAEQHYSADGKTFHMSIDVEFAPMACPSRWSYYRIKKSISDTFRYFFSFFQ